MTLYDGPQRAEHSRAYWFLAWLGCSVSASVTGWFLIGVAGYPIPLVVAMVVLFSAALGYRIRNPARIVFKGDHVSVPSSPPIWFVVSTVTLTGAAAGLRMLRPSPVGYLLFSAAIIAWAMSGVLTGVRLRRGSTAARVVTIGAAAYLVLTLGLRCLVVASQGEHQIAVIVGVDTLVTAGALVFLLSRR